MKHLKTYILLFVTFTAFCFLGCIDDPVKNHDSLIQGTTYDKFGMTNPYVKVSVGDYPIVAPDIFGKFTLENNNFPYNLTTTNENSFSQKYLGLTLKDPNIITFEHYGNSNFCNVKVNFPMITTSYEEAIIRFISADKCTQFDFNVPPLRPSMDISIDILKGKNRIEGKLIFLQYTIYDYATVWSYEKFGVKDITLNSGITNPEVTFTNEDVEFNPNELHPTFNIHLSNGFTHLNSYVSLVFPGMEYNSILEIPSYYYNETSGYLTIPELPGIDYKIKFTNYASFSSNYFTSKKWEIVDPGENIDMIHNKTISLQQPLHNEKNVNDNTVFSIHDDLPGGIYVFRILVATITDFQEISIVTDRNSIYFKDFKTWNYQFKPNIEYEWGVFKYPGYKNIDDFASSKYTEDTLQRIIPASEMFTFTIR